MTEPVDGDEPLLSLPETRDIRVVVLLSATEYVALTHLCEQAGLKQSSFVRMLLRERMVRAAAAAEGASGE